MRKATCTRLDLPTGKVVEDGGVRSTRVEPVVLLGLLDP